MLGLKISGVLNPTNHWKLSRSLSLLIVSRYSTVVVLVVEVVVVVLEVVSASSQQRPASQTVSPVVVVQYFSLLFDGLHD